MQESMFRGRTALLAAAAAAAALALPTAGSRVGDCVAQDAADAVEAREWTQPGGDCARRSSSPLAPVRGAPRIAWRHPLSGPALSEPVCWGGIVYVASGTERNRELAAFRATTGERVAVKPLGAGNGTVVLTSQGVAVVVDDAKVRGFPLRADGFALGWTATKVGVEAPVRATLARGVVYVESRQGLMAIAADSGKVYGAVAGVSSGRSAPAAQRTADGVVLRRVYSSLHEHYEGNWVGVEAVEVGFAGGRLAPPSRPVSGRLLLAHDDSGAADAWCTWLERDLSKAVWDRVYVMGLTFPTSKRGTVPAAILPAIGDASLSRIATRPAAHGARLFGFDAEGRLIDQAADGSYFVLVEAKDLPAGARPGPATAVGDVLYFGNWAVEIPTRRVLWCLKDLSPATPAVPVTDGRLAVVTTSNELVCLEDPSIPPATASAASGDAPRTSSAAAEAPAQRPPADFAGCLLADGTVVAGAVTVAADGTVRIAGAKGEPQVLRPHEVALATADGKVVHRGEEYGAYAAWRRALEGEAAAAYAELFRKAVSEGVLPAARTYLTRARSFGIGDAQAEALDRMLTGRLPHANAALKQPRLDAAEAEITSAVADGALQASEWLASRGCGTAATAVLDVGIRAAPARADLVARALQLVPPEFPQIGSSDRGREWLRWAAELVPAGAAFVAPSDPLWQRLASEPAWAKGAIALRSRTVLFVSKTADPAVVGPCLRNGEGAVRALDALFRDGVPLPVTGDADRLEVRLHADRKSYMAERTPYGGAMTWSAGYYSPAEKVSRFYVPGGDEEAAARGRTLFRVLAHELTHHYIEQRWAEGRGAGAATPGYWVVEGVANFVEEQTVEMGRSGLRFDDPTVESVDMSAQIDAKGLLYPLGRFLELSHLGFRQIEQKPVATVQLRNTLAGFEVDRISLFYAQAGSVAFWLIHRGGAEGRKRFIDYLRLHYDGRTVRDVAAAFGFASAAEMEAEYRKFLAAQRAR